MPNNIVTKEEIVAQRSDLSQFLIHLTRDTSHYTNGVHRTTTASRNLESIIQSTTLQARQSYSYFKYRSGQHIQANWLNSVCFTETPLKNIQIQFQRIPNRQIHFQPYGLAFFETAVRQANGNPVIYVDTVNRNNLTEMDAIKNDPNCAQFRGLLHLFQTFGPGFGSMAHLNIDFRWEREWRIQGNFQFNIRASIAFGLCPDTEINHFEALVGNGIPFVDPRDHPTASAKLRNHQRLRGYTF